MLPRSNFKLKPNAESTLAQRRGDLNKSHEELPRGDRDTSLLSNAGKYQINSVSPVTPQGKFGKNWGSFIDRERAYSKVGLATRNEVPSRNRNARS